MPSLRDIILKQQERFSKFKKYDRVVKCLMRDVDARYDPNVAGRTGYVWVQEEGTNSLFQAFNPHVTPIAGLKVLVGIPPENSDGRRVVLSLDWSVYPDDKDNPFSGTIYTEKHSVTHEWSDDGYGPDAMSVYQRSMVPFRVQVYTDTQIVAMPGIFLDEDAIKTFHGAFKDFIADFPNALYTRVTVSLNPDTIALAFNYSAEEADPDDCDFEAPPAGNIPLAYVLLNGATGILLESLITDTRPFIQAPAAGAAPADFTYWSIDAPPPSPSAYDDEFDDAAVAGKWTEYDPSGDITVAEVEAGMTFVSIANNKIAGLYQDVPPADTDWSFVVRVQFLGVLANDQVAGIFLSEDISSNPNTCDHETFGFGPQAAGMGLFVKNWSDYQTINGVRYAVTETVPAMTSAYLRIRLETVVPGLIFDWTFDYSSDGISWIEVYNRNREFVPAEFGIYSRTNRSDGLILFSFFRAFPDDSDLTDIVLGDRVNGFYAS